MVEEDVKEVVADESVSIGFVFKNNKSCEMVFNLNGIPSPAQLAIVLAYIEEFTRVNVNADLQKMFTPKKPNLFVPKFK